MTREEFVDKVLESTSNNFIVEAATGFGKTKTALSKTMQWFTSDTKILIVIPRNVLIESWLEEIKKWELTEIVNNITFVTYVSLPKMAGRWDIVILDEAHHTSERCQEALTNGFTIKHLLVLSATIKRDTKWFFKNYCNNQIEEIVVRLHDAITDEVLPEPEIYIIPLKLDNSKANCVYEKKGRKGINSTITVSYTDKWKYKGYAGTVRFRCTQQQYYNEISGLIDWYKRKSHNPVMKNMWLHKCNDRLKWLSDQKTTLIKYLLDVLKNQRVLTFCGSIEQSDNLGTYCVNSKVGTENLKKFNDKKIKHIAAVGMLDEGQNLTDCKIGLFQMLNSSDRLTIQRCGRIIRHKKPVFIFPYFIGTREEEILKTILESYNKNLIHVIKDIRDFKL